MPNKKKHLKYRAAKISPQESQASATVKAGDTQVNTKTSPNQAVTPLRSTKIAKQSENYTRLSATEQKVVKKELRHILYIAIGILLVYAVFWAGFHYAGWSESILRFIPHGQ